LLKIVDKKEKEIAEAQEAVAKVQAIAESKDREIRVTKDLMERAKVMSELLESVQTGKLANSFDKYLPAVMEGAQKKVVKATLNESTEVTGNRESKPEVGLDNIVDIRKLAGLSK